MPISIQDHGQNNKISIDPQVMENSHAVILLHGSDNRISVASGVSFLQGNITLGEACSLTVGVDCRLAAIEIMASRNAHVAIGPRSEFTWSTRLYLHEPGYITIGADCLVASATLMMVSDMHSILDLTTGQRINPAADIAIADRVWLAHESTLLKGATIGSGSVVGYRAVVSGAIPANSLAVGSPARVVKTGISWDPRLL